MCVHTLDAYRSGSLSVPFVPRTTKYRPLESVVAGNPMGWSYQLYFANEDSSEEIGNNARQLLNVKVKTNG